MTIFIYEHLTSGALSEEVFSAGLMREGELMLESICRDLLAYGYKVALMRDSRLPALTISTDRLTTYPIQNQLQFTETWQQCQQHYDFFLVIAPETDSILFNFVLPLEQQQKRIFNCSSSAIRLCSDKYLCYQHLKKHHITTPKTFTASDWLREDHSTKAQWIIKPIDGAGCESTYCSDSVDTRQRLSTLPKDKFIVQTYISGENLSLSLFINEGETQLLSVNIQHIKQDQQQLHLGYCEAQRFDMLSREQALSLANQISHCIDGLSGFVGIDIVKTTNAIYVIEVNPRLTSTYAEPAMREKTNPAETLNKQIQALLAK
jgi:predicted ATP-grasp superfamily ATP-dependent carboligase